ncbi:MAG: S9 family peptidase [Balneolaceae bacterium]|nr:S9 family peptidase [Balneolaceae bacterium]MBO6545352.1 S9 family peptidase [Balneolaceae bacterium]MBO6646748.1 S9 family peptidase [Balneolaceae bacterium]
MRSYLNNLLALVVIFVMANPIAHAQDSPSFSAMDVFELQWVDNPQISPDGNHVVFSRRGFNKMTDRRTSSLWIINSDGSGHRKLTSRTGGEGSAIWSPSGDRIAFTSSEEGHGSEIFIYWLESGVTARITQLENSPGGLAWSPDGQHLAFTMKVEESNPVLVKSPKKPKGAEWAPAPRVTTRLNYEQDGSGYISPGYRHIFVAPADGGAVQQLTHGDFDHGSPVWSPEGDRIYFSANRNEDHEKVAGYRNSEVYSVELNNRTITALTDRFGPDSGPAISPDGETIAYLGYDDKIQTYQVRHIYLMNADGSNKRMVETGLDRSPSSLTWKANGRGLYFMYDDEGITKLAETDLRGNVNVLAENLGGTAIGRPYGGGSYSVSDNGDIAMNLTSPEHPAELAVKRNNRDTQLITSLNEALLGNRTLGRVEDYRYTSSVDGIDLQGWLIYPPNYDESRSYPLLVEIHGGPISNYGPRFTPELQLMASAGYVVFYPNMRGSTSYGEEFGNLLYHDYPGDDYHDVMDGVDGLIEQGITSEDSLFVTGGSAGGILTAWIIGKNNRFESAAVVKPVMNWISKTLVADNYYGYAEYRLPGQPWEEFETYWKYSPISLVGNIETPTLVMVGTADMRTPLSEAKQLYGALKIREIETALVEIPGSWHFIANRPSQLITKIEHILAWFEKTGK